MYASRILHYYHPFCRSNDINVEYYIAVSCGVLIDSTRHMVVYSIGCCVEMKQKLWILQSSVTLYCSVLFMNT
jgi:hypothetical protein